MPVPMAALPKAVGISRNASGKTGQWVKGAGLIGGWDYPDRQRNSNGEFAPSGTPYAVKAKGVIYLRRTGAQVMAAAAWKNECWSLPET